MNAPEWVNTLYDETDSAKAQTALNAMEVDVGFEWGTFWTPNPLINDKIYSEHPGGYNVTFCDGHQQFLRSTIDIPTFIHLMTPYDRGCPKNDNSNTVYCNVPDSVIPGSNTSQDSASGRS